MLNQIIFIITTVALIAFINWAYEDEMPKMLKFCLKMTRAASALAILFVLGVMVI